MLLLRQFLSELHDILIQCFSVSSVYMILTDSRSESYDVIDNVITYNHIIIIIIIIIIIVTTLGLNISETRPDSGMVATYSE